MKIKTVIDKTEKFIETHERAIIAALFFTSGFTTACISIGVVMSIASKDAKLIYEGEAAKFFLRQMLEPIVENATPIS